MSQNTQGNQAPGGQGQAAPIANRSFTIQPAQIQQLARQCNIEISKARELGTDSAEGQEHLKKAQRIKNILMQYQQQQQQQQNQSSQNSSQSATPTAQPLQTQQQQNQQFNQFNNSQPTLSPQLNQPQQPTRPQQSVQKPAPQQAQATNNNLATAAPRVNTSSPSPLAQNSPAPQQSTLSPIEQLQQLKQILTECTKKLKVIEDAKKSSMLPPESMAKILQQEQIIKERYNSYKNAALQISQRLQRQQQQLNGQQSNIQRAASQHAQQVQAQQQLSNASIPQISQNTTNMQQNNSAQSQLAQQQIAANATARGNFQAQSQPQQRPPSSNSASNQFQQQQSSPHLSQQGVTPQQQQQPPLQQQTQQSPLIQAPNSSQQSPQISQQSNNFNQIPPQNQALRNGLQSRTGTPQPPQDTNNTPQNRTVHNSQSPSTPVTNVNAAAKPNGSTNSIAQPPVFKSAVPSIQVPAQINVKPQNPVTVAQNRPSLTGGNGISSAALTTPALLKLPPYEMQSDRVLSKRKLSELVKTVGVDEGDGETTIDGDVEELLLDLADEFVTNITGFACRLAKHRKSENLEAKDIQLHLEKNLDIRIPGFSSDEIRSVRKWPANSSHTQRIQGIEISKSVEHNK